MKGVILCNTTKKRRWLIFWIDDSKIPLVIVACGSYSPITYLHLRMFGKEHCQDGHWSVDAHPLFAGYCVEMAKDHLNERTDYELVAGYYSPVSDAYMKEGLAKASHRVNMCQLAVDSTSDWLMVDSWESRQPMYQRTAFVLDHFDYELNNVGGGIKTSTGKCRECSSWISSLIKAMIIRSSQANQDHVAGGWWSDGIVWTSWRLDTGRCKPGIYVCMCWSSSNCGVMYSCIT